ncbi:MAG: NifU family protein [Acidimicrobiia bacterium]|nr:NifU family protein [Acidimicrobiia bacterium]
MTETTILSVDPDALAMITELRDQEEGDGEFGLLIEVTGLRGAEFQYELSFTPVADAGTDTIVERHGDLALMMPIDDVEKLRGSSLNLTDRGLAMNNPNSPATPAMQGPKGDLTGPLADQVQQVLREQVNPAIASHGGAAELVSVDEGYAYLRLMGGCQGCGMASMTLSQGIERILTEAIPELVGVVDVTDHASGTDPYYQQAKK